MNSGFINHYISLFSMIDTAYVLLPPVLLAVLIYLLIRFCARGKARIALIVSIAFMSFGFVGISAGFITGFSRSPAITALIPAALTFIGGISIISFKNGTLSKVLSIVAVSSFAVNLTYGSIMGARVRTISEAYFNSFDFQKRQIETEFRINLYKKSLGVD